MAKALEVSNVMRIVGVFDAQVVWKPLDLLVSNGEVDTIRRNSFVERHYPSDAEEGRTEGRQVARKVSPQALDLDARTDIRPNDRNFLSSMEGVWLALGVFAAVFERELLVEEFRQAHRELLCS